MNTASPQAVVRACCMIPRERARDAIQQYFYLVHFLFADEVWVQVGLSRLPSAFSSGLQ